MGPDMKRREFIISLAGTAAVWPLAATAQKAPARIGWLSSGSEKSAVGLGFVADIKDGLRENGMIEGRDYMLEARYADGVYERFPDLVRELVQARVAIIVTNTIASVRAAQRITPPVPIVMCPINDPVGNGLIASLARPGGMTTGVATLNEDLTAKMLEFQRTVIAAVRTIAAIYNPGNPSNVQALEGIRTRALEMGINVLPNGAEVAAGAEGRVGDGCVGQAGAAADHRRFRNAGHDGSYRRLLRKRSGCRAFPRRETTPRSAGCWRTARRGGSS